MITDLNHITLSISNMDRSLHFYEGLLGFKSVAIWEEGAYLLATKIWLCLSLDLSYQKGLTRDYSHIAFSLSKHHFNDCCHASNVHQFKRWKKNKSFGESLYILDPDGHQLELHTSSLSQRLEELSHHPYSGLMLSPNWKNLLKECQLP